jgi:hypothetical protein
LIRVGNSAEKGMFGMDKFSSVIDKMNMKLGSKFLNSLRIKTQLLSRRQCVIDADGAPTPKGCVESIGSSLKDGAEAFIYAVPARRLAGSAF